MKFTKGLLVGGLIATGILMMYSDTNMMNKNKMMNLFIFDKVLEG